MSKNVKLTIAGIDAGNNSVKLILENGQTLNYENIYCERNKIKLERDYKINGIEDVNKYTLKDYLDVEVCYDNEKYGFLFGEQAKVNKTKVSERENKYKSTDNQLIMNSMVALGNALISNLDKNEWKETLHFDVALSVGLPFHEYQIEGTIEDYKKRFLKTFKINFLNPSYPVRSVTITVKDIHVVIEGYSALRQTLFDQGYFDKEVKKVKGKAASIIDIGCYSVDIVSGKFFRKVDEEGEEFPIFKSDNEICTGITEGVGTAMDNVILSLSSELAREIGQHRKITRQEIFAAAEEDNIIEGTKISIEPYYSQECARLGRMIGERYVQLILQGGYKDTLVKIYVAGGGALNDFIMKSFKQVLKEEGFDLDIVEIVDNPVFANATGYFNIADANFGVIEE